MSWLRTSDGTLAAVREPTAAGLGHKPIEQHEATSFWHERSRPALFTGKACMLVCCSFPAFCLTLLHPQACSPALQAGTAAAAVDVVSKVEDAANNGRRITEWITDIGELQKVRVVHRQETRQAGRGIMDAVEHQARGHQGCLLALLWVQGGGAAPEGGWEVEGQAGRAPASLLQLQALWRQPIAVPPGAGAAEEVLLKGIGRCGQHSGVPSRAAGMW